MKNLLISVTGHRPQHLGGFDNKEIKLKIKKWLYQVLKNLEDKEYKVHGFCGMALGVDQWFAEVCIKMNVPFHAVVPCKNFECKWPHNSQEHYRKLLEKAIDVTYVGETYDFSLPQKRNELLVDSCEFLIAIYNGKSNGGTKNCIDYAKKVNKKILYCPKEIFNSI